MDWTTKPLARASALTGKPFAEGDSIVSFVVRTQGDLLERLDYLESELTPETTPAAEILGRWQRVVKPTPVSKKEAREQATAGVEEMFLALAAEGAAPAEDIDRVGLIQMLALTLERRRMLKPMDAADGVQRYLHLATQTPYDVRTVALTPELLMRIQPQLPELGA